MPGGGVGVVLVNGVPRKGLTEEVMFEKEPEGASHAEVHEKSIQAEGREKLGRPQGQACLEYLSSVKGTSEAGTVTQQKRR